MEKVDIVFSVLAHEKAETLIDTIINIKYYNENCGIIIHISSAFDWDGSMIDEETFYKAVEEMESVWINPQHVRSCRDILAKLHILNFDYVKKVCEFKFFSLMASNCAFIKSGVADFMDRNDYLAAFDYFNIENKGAWEWNCCLKEKQYNKLLSKWASMHKEHLEDKLKEVFIRLSFLSTWQIRSNVTMILRV